ncbi:F-box/WD repeat-containing protein 12 [Sorex araneus]|uniref:F-box/WD repeat-containing protein 12 n=1 Tax=Sorex araneus TaxID=42254 RepID=UPI002433FAAC|nr:F-box/WD repeat-containing protein 12 [Sorex araneus]
MEIQLPEVPLLRIFSFLDVISLLQVSKVNKSWKKVAETESLWRNLCLKKWSFCNFTQLQGTQTWKNFFLHLTRQERQMALAEPQDFNVKVTKDKIGVIGAMAYLSGNGHTEDAQEKSILCTLSSKCILYAWDVQEGVVIWESPVQRTRLLNLATLPQMHLVFTVDMEGKIKMWNCWDKEDLATLSMPNPCFSLETCVTVEGSFLMVGSIKGEIYTLTVPELREVSKIKAFEYSVDFLNFSPDNKWLFACGSHQVTLPTVFLTEYLLNPAGNHVPATLSVPSSSCCTNSWAPRRPNRIIVMFRKGFVNATGFITFDITAERTEGNIVVTASQIASFRLPAHMEIPTWMGVSDGNTIAFESGPFLFLFSIRGLQIQQFEHHQRNIVCLWADSVHVLTAGMDDSLHMYMWEEGDRSPYLKSCFHLQYRDALGSAPNCYLSKAICDNRSIVYVVSKIRESSMLLMYSLKKNYGH